MKIASRRDVAVANMLPATGQVPWTAISPGLADDLDLDLREIPEIAGPRNEAGQVCPWPWEPEMFDRTPLGWYRCSWCNAEVYAGVPHIDYGDEDYS